MTENKIAVFQGKQIRKILLRGVRAPKTKAQQF